MSAGGRNTHQTHQRNSHRPHTLTPRGNLEHPNVANQANVHLFGHVGGILRSMGNPRGGGGARKPLTGSETRTFWDPQWRKLPLVMSLYLFKQRLVRPNIYSDGKSRKCQRKTR